MDSTETQPATRPKRYSSGKMATGIARLLTALIVLATFTILSFLHAHDVSTELAANPNATFTPNGDPYAPAWVLALVCVMFMLGLILVGGAFDSGERAMSYIEFLEKQHAVEKAEWETKYATLDEDTRDYRIARRAAQIRNDGTLIEEMIASEFGGNPPQKDERHGY